MHTNIPNTQPDKTDTDTPTILLVDDNAINLQTLYQILGEKKYKLLVARSGDDALKIARKVLPDLILLDIMMPGIDGYETCRQLKADNKTKNAAIIFLTALQGTQEKVNGLDIGAVDYITKPFDPDEILARVSRHLKETRRHQALQKTNQKLAEQIGIAMGTEFPDPLKHSALIKSLISAGENDMVEFKSTLRWNLKSDRADKLVEKAWLKTIVAFLNTHGGVLLVGVEDDGSILGTAVDQFENEDKYLLTVNNKIHQHIGLESASFIRFKLVPVNDKKVFMVDCKPSPSPVFLRIGKDEEFYIRVGPGSRRLSTSEVLAYLANRK
jgi:CheY-like chemotaxis protein